MGWLAGGMAVFAPPPPLVAMGRVISMPGAPQGVFVLWVCGFFVFLPFLFTPHPPVGPFPTPGPCVFTLLSGCLFLSLCLSLSGTLSGHCLCCSCLLCQIRDTFQVPKALSDYSVLCWFFSFLLVIFRYLFFFLFLHTNTCCSQPPPPIQRWGLGMFCPQAQKRISGGKSWAFQADKNKIKNTLASEK